MAGLPNPLAGLWKPLAGWRAPLARWRRAPTDSGRYRRSSCLQNSRGPEPAPPQVPLDNAARRTLAGFGAVPPVVLTAPAWPVRPEPSFAGADAETAWREATLPACCLAEPTAASGAVSVCPAGASQSVTRSATLFAREGTGLRGLLASS
ncbi:MAG: hypothetical protein ABW318_23385 [Vicinamibacterales bacterium]